ncbi:endonuclease [Thiorhodococcus mannitoliphagus]|uniref:Endonuclease n=1 Tax=Thiorhodococcus mannitoliphagus TaxID=329406 RepID=A0A6P1E0J2_9GAMM|nr:endonuclease/exonuclease/phosphatase family protein [Thiorhodococcus mannitoliphagus]NEX23290.1 endonuclease [Thiorhodococcus mannitoliphagus]
MTRAQPGLRVATYNIHRAQGRDGRLDPRRIAEVILSLDADLVALQEVETPHAPAPILLLSRLIEQGYAPVLGPTMRSDAHHYGNVLLTRLPVHAKVRIDLSRPGREPRGLVDVRLGLTGARGAEAGGSARGVLHCLATHLGLSAAERRGQIARIAARLDAIRQGLGDTTPVILLGDFNEWHPSPRLKPLDARLERVARRATWPAGWPLLALDRIWFGGSLTLESSWVVRTRQTRLASDHLPLVARFRLSDPLR